MIKYYLIPLLIITIETCFKIFKKEYKTPIQIIMLAVHLIAIISSLIIYFYVIY